MTVPVACRLTVPLDEGFGTLPVHCASNGAVQAIDEASSGESRNKTDA